MPNSEYLPTSDALSTGTPKPASSAGSPHTFPRPSDGARVPQLFKTPPLPAGLVTKTGFFRYRWVNTSSPFCPELNATHRVLELTDQRAPRSLALCEGSRKSLGLISCSLTTAPQRGPPLQPKGIHRRRSARPALGMLSRCRRGARMRGPAAERREAGGASRCGRPMAVGGGGRR